MQSRPRPEPTPNPLLQACALLFLFRALVRSEDAAQRVIWEERILWLIRDLVPCSGGAVLLGDSIGKVEEDCVALPLYIRGDPGGLLAIRFPPEQLGNLAAHRETLSAVAMLASAALENVWDVERLRTENALLRARLDPAEGGIIGDNPAIQKLMQMIARLAPQETSVLVLGESGTGKELVARALHNRSRRASGPFVAINCAALTETLLESELFGHEKGAFTGAAAQKKGRLELAEGGTVFLDEIGELASPLQAKLLRVLQQREFERVGGTRTLKLDVRLIAATNRDLAAEVRRGAFREDLYHRLNVVSSRVPPLRERPGDIPALARYFLDRTAERCQRRVSRISPEAERYLIGYSWPGNVRELENAIERAVVFGQSDTLLPEDLPESILNSTAEAVPGTLESSIAGIKRQAILAAWQQAAGDHNRAAALLHIHPNSLRRLIRILNLREMLP
jgi:Nif-specific regulatory protein